MHPMSIGVLLRSYRISLGLSQEALAERSGVSIRTISDLERGIRDAARQDTATLLADALELTGDTRKAFVTIAHRDTSRSPRNPGGERSDSGQRIQLPVPPTPTIGRDEVIAAIGERIKSGEQRILTLTGPGGVGKTRLALLVAAASHGWFSGRVHFIDLTQTNRSADVIPTLCTVAGIQPAGDKVDVSRLAQALSSEPYLYVLDNFEHLVEASPEVARLSALAPSLQLVITSRVRLRLQGEHDVLVEPLDVPPPDANIEAICESGAVQLFAQRALASNPGFALDARNALVVAEICRRLEGMPLAIELATGRLSVLTPTTLLELLETRLPLLSGVIRDAPARHHTMRAAIATSYDLLSGQEQDLLRKLSVFTGGFSLDSAEQIARTSGYSETESLDAISRLVDANLIRQVVASNGSSRFTMFETIREFCAEQLTELKLDAQARQIHCQVMVDFAESIRLQDIVTTPPWWLEKVQIEFANLRSALDTAIVFNDVKSGLNLACACIRFWYIRGPVQDALSMLDDTGLLAQAKNDSLGLEAMFWAANVAYPAGDMNLAETVADDLLTRALSVGNRRAEANALHVLALVRQDMGDWKTSASYLAREEQLGIEMEDPLRILIVKFLQANLAFGLGDAVVAIRIEKEANELAKAQDDLRFIAGTEFHIGFFSADDGNLFDIARSFRQSLEIWIDIDETTSVFKPLAALADVAARMGQYERAASLIGACDDYLRRTGFRLYPFDMPAHERAGSLSRSQLPEESFLSAYELGKRWSPEEWMRAADDIVDAALLRAD